MSTAAETKAQRLRRLDQVAAVFVTKPSPMALAAGLLVAVSARLVAAGGFGWFDLVAVGVVLALAPLFEWCIHLFILHRQPRRIGRLLFDPGAGHRQHHLNPASINWVLLRWPDAVVFQLVNAAIIAGLLWPALRLAGVEPAGPILTGVVAAIGALFHYEWSHFLFHTGYRPKSRYYQRMKRNHRLHHWRNERYWLGITANAADRLFRTYPASRSAVPLSPTARTLDPDPGDNPSNLGDNPSD